MPVADMLIQGLELMGLGMGIVFAFLVLQVFVMQAMSKLAFWIGGSEEDVVPDRGQMGSRQKGEGDDLIAAITAAVHSYRARHR